MMKKKKWIFTSLAIVVVLLITVIYTVFDNERVNVVHQEVVIENLPQEFEGFTMLQISDLHGKEFGLKQQRLLALINSLDYDMLVFTGDMANSKTQDMQPLLDLIDGTQNKEYAYFTAGNTGPWTMDEFTGILTKDGETLEARGVHNLNQTFVIQRGDSRLFVSDLTFMEWVLIFNLGFSRQQLERTDLSPVDKERFQNMETYALQRMDEFSQIKVNDTLIGITHYPFTIDSASSMPENNPPYDLVVAGHYHGGQIRLPFIGALYIPDAASETYGFFPRQDEVSGLRDWGDFQQYVSRGLGSSSIVPFLKFRFLNTPEINLITLVGKNKN